jgi:hypothetical protein
MSRYCVRPKTLLTHDFICPNNRLPMLYVQVSYLSQKSSSWNIRCCAVGFHNGSFRLLVDLTLLNVVKRNDPHFFTLTTYYSSLSWNKTQETVCQELFASASGY